MEKWSVGQGESEGKPEGTPEGTPEKTQQEKGEASMNPDSIYGSNGWSQALATLALFGGGFPFGGRGRDYGHGGNRVTDEAIVATIRQPSAADVNAAMAAQEQRISDLGRQIAEQAQSTQNIGRDLQLQASQNALLQNQQAAETRREQLKCCCDTQKEILDSRHTTALGFRDVTKQLCDVENSLAKQMAAQELSSTQAALSDTKAALRIAEQTAQMQNVAAAAVASAVQQVTSQCCCDPCKGHGHGGGGGKSDIASLMMLLQQQGWTPPGQGKK